MVAWRGSPSIRPISPKQSPPCNVVTERVSSPTVVHISALPGGDNVKVMSLISLAGQDLALGRSGRG